ncbi:MAG: 54S ribosomal protein, mitochondrial [Chrysothrix sp. TS-e1954]|nr:MAG: 54S ribosomal protein, mitochondrial [Chrysothrix sp. TS-e1954]
MASRPMKLLSGLIRHTGRYQRDARTSLCHTSLPFRPAVSRSMATVSDDPIRLDPQPESLEEEPTALYTHSESVEDAIRASLTTTVVPPSASPQPSSTVLTTVHSFPYMEPLHFAYYPTSHLFLPLRKDLLHRAVIYEGDNTRQGTASTKHRSEVHGSHRKLRRQKGSGHARVGDKQSPIRVGGGVAFGPKPRDFGTKLPKKIYDKAWRTALSFRYRRGQLVIVDKMADLDVDGAFYVRRVFEANGWGNADGRSMLVARQETEENEGLRDCLGTAGDQGRFETVDGVDVKNILSMGRVIVEKDALDELLTRHMSDLVPPVVPVGPRMVEELEEAS